MDLWIWIVAGVVAAVVLFALVAAGTRLARRTGQRKRHQQELERRFGPEYQLAVKANGRKGAEETLDRRLSEFEGVDHPGLGPSERETHTTVWREAQFHFVDSPERAVREAEHIVVTVMEERGYRAEDASVRAEALSVEDAELANAYRAAHRAFLAADRGDARVEQLLGAFLVYREILEFLLARPQREDTVFDAEPPSEDEAPSPVRGSPLHPRRPNPLAETSNGRRT